MIKFFKYFFAFVLLCISQSIYSQKSNTNQLIGTWVLDSIFVKSGWIKVIHSDKLQIDSNFLTRYIIWSNQRENYFTQGNNLIKPGNIDTTEEVFKRKLSIKGNDFKLKKGNFTDKKGGMKLRSLGKFIREESKLIISDEWFIWYYHLEST